MSAAAGDAGILIVDDMEENLFALEAVLSSLGRRLVRVSSGEEALKAMLRQEFAVVLLDVLMPGMDGFETAANIKRLDQTKDVPIILLTGVEADADYAYRGYAIGAADFLIKPFDPWLLRTKVNVFLDLHRQKRQLASQAEQLKRLLVADDRSPTRPAAAQTTESAEADRFADIVERLTRIEMLLRGAEGAEAAGLADRIAGLEHAVANLLAGRDA